MASSKIIKPAGKQPDEFEMKVAEELFKLEASSPDLKVDLEHLYILGAKEVVVQGAKKACVLMVPYKLLPQFKAIHVRLVRELEKKLQGRHVVIIAHRTIYGDSYNRNVKTRGVRPRSRTLTAVQEGILDDLVFPTEIVGKRTRYKLDGSKQLKVLMNAKDQMQIETKLDTFAAVYKKLTNKDVVFEFPVES
uniref:40S ribosomal protein S7 n=2 Tax=Stramenopiles TaxID=33634 RepID=A0A7S2RUE9_9STRA|mmetsp:Transcript_382/g.695  ORF Transcript_382/g.695 Transcript_382/m.695 type:complete len:192 (-) Transcript_382:91-666(-)|eukprot:CAMPEP_0203745558 /NCGR_PEP_ID=MMETSP0098-20131031/1252_1 /ASSEMBLY_ACC=CAM_ASM_000208 /TAXON_ID=96639 /ORGANISM=" , Strain NY0313808BC1" /LENGTH=191 /DNA_ID=CAMNT_0050633365 /DNA_START=52 /DNA_END=627 /DNA_ORIENTATION=-